MLDAAHPKTKPRVFLVGNARKAAVPALFDRLARWLDERGVLVGQDLSGHPQTAIATHPDFVVVLGGDGTILAVGQALGEQQVPIIGVNLGKLGYLGDFSIEELQRHFDQIVSDPALVSRRMILNVLSVEPSGTTWRGMALNDCVIRAGSPFRTVSLDLAIDGERVTNTVGDGLIIATPTGSTAHNLSAGGPILRPEVEAFILTPLAPHSLTHRPVVVGPNTHVDVTVHHGNQGTTAVLDGQIVHPLPEGSHLHARRASQCFQLVRSPMRKPWDTLVQKLKWGQNLG